MEVDFDMRRLGQDQRRQENREDHGSSPSRRPTGSAPATDTGTVAPSDRPTPSGSGSLRTHAIVLRVVLELAEAELLHQRRDVDAEPPPKALLQAVPSADGVFR